MEEKQRDALLKTALHGWHCGAEGVKMGEFAGYHMPLFYKAGGLQEHHWTRMKVGIFDVSHMGHIEMIGAGASSLLELVTPSVFTSMSDWRAKYTTLLNEEGGIVDDLIVIKLKAEHYRLVVNASRQSIDFAFISQLKEQSGLQDVQLRRLLHESTIAVQGSSSEAVLQSLFPENLSSMYYGMVKRCSFDGVSALVSRIGYTGEDGFEVVIPNQRVEEFWRKLLADDSLVRPVGLVARDGLRLEMGYPLYGADLQETTTLKAASLYWLMNSKNTTCIARNALLKVAPKQRRVGIQLEEKGMLRPGCRLYTKGGTEVGTITSAGYSPSLSRSIAQAFVNVEAIEEREALWCQLRAQRCLVYLKNFPFVPEKTKRLRRSLC